ncbi:MAG: S8 family serine peptidase, partial [Nanoarchaeota archaeon]
VFLLAMIFMLFVGFVSYSGTAENIGMGWGALIETDEATTQTSGLDDFFKANPSITDITIDLTEEVPQVFVPPKDTHSYISTFGDDGSKILDSTLAASLNQAGISFVEQDIENYMSDNEISLLFYYSGTRRGDELSSAVSKAGGEFGRALITQPVFSATISQDQISTFVSSIKQSLSINKIEVNSKFYVNLDESVPMMLSEQERTDLEIRYGPVDGTGVKIAILDTGINKDHSDLDDLDDNPSTTDPKVIAEADFTDDGFVDDLSGHGTHCASTAAGTGELSGYQFVGVAPRAQLLNGKVLTYRGYGYEDWIAAGIEWATDNGADVISMSLGGPPGQDLMNSMIQYAVDSGVVVTVSAGNDDFHFTIGSPGDSEEAITVGAVDKNKIKARFSSGGPTENMLVKPDVMAPGTTTYSYSGEKIGICAARVKGGDIEQYYIEHYGLDYFIENFLVPCDYPNEPETYDIAEYWAISGTSMAAPHVAGAAALLIQIHPDWTPERIKSSMVNYAEDLGYDVYYQGGGFVKIKDAAESDLFISPGILNNKQKMNDFDFFFTVVNEKNEQRGIRIKPDVDIEEVKTRINYDLTPFSNTEFCLSAGNQQTINGYAVISSLPMGYYGGKIFAEVYTDCNFNQKERELIIPFGFTKIKKLIVHYHAPFWFGDNPPITKKSIIARYVSNSYPYSKEIDSPFIRPNPTEEDFTREYYIPKDVFDLEIVFYTKKYNNPVKVRFTGYLKKVDMTSLDELEIWVNEEDAIVYDNTDVEFFRENHEMSRTTGQFELIQPHCGIGWATGDWWVDSKSPENELIIALYSEPDLITGGWEMGVLDKGVKQDLTEYGDFYFYQKYPFVNTKFELIPSDINEREVRVNYPFIEPFKQFSQNEFGLLGFLATYPIVVFEAPNIEEIPYNTKIYFNDPFESPYEGSVFITASYWPMEEEQIGIIWGGILYKPTEKDEFNFYKTPFSLDISAYTPYHVEVFDYDPNDYQDTLYGYIKGAANTLEEWRIHYGSDAKITTPQGDIFYSEKLIDWSGDYSLHITCEPGNHNSNAIDLTPCQEGIYHINWILRDVISHKPCLEADFYYDGEKFTLLNKISGELTEAVRWENAPLPHPVIYEECVPIIGDIPTPRP